MSERTGSGRANLFALFTGVAATVLGAMTVLAIADAAPDRALLVVAETITCLLFTTLTVAAWTVRPPATGTAIAILAAVVKVLWIGIGIPSHWSRGWSAMMDGYYSPGQSFLLTTILQAIAMIVVAGASLQRSSGRA
jgi:hypothetical protein